MTDLQAIILDDDDLSAQLERDIVDRNIDVDGWVRSLTEDEVAEHNASSIAHPDIRALISGALKYTTIFTDADLTVAGFLVKTHSLNVFPNAVAIWDNVGEFVYVGSIAVLTNDVVSIDLSDFRPLQGIWRLIING